eukprot:CCRYP_015613-RA/>CCRYP_015613-RA protein AED:0.00 eAED:0.00 QI:43/1/1/1/0/0/2/131/38
MRESTHSSKYLSVSLCVSPVERGGNEKPNPFSTIRRNL